MVYEHIPNTDVLQMFEKTICYVTLYLRFILHIKNKQLIMLNLQMSSEKHKLRRYLCAFKASSWIHSFFLPILYMPTINIKTKIYVIFDSLQHMKVNLSRVMRKPMFWFPTWSDTNQAVQLQKMARSLKFRI